MKFVQTLLAAFAALVLGAGCFEIEPPDPPAVGSAIEGDLRVGPSAASVGAFGVGETLSPTARTLQRDLSLDRKEARWMPGDLLVAGPFGTVGRVDLQEKLSRALVREGIPAQVRTERCVARYLCLVRASDLEGKPLAAEPTRELAQRLHALRVDGVSQVGVNGIKYAMRAPNDEHFDLQWHLGFARIPQAWDITVGASDVVVGVVDSGMNLSHPDAIGRLLPGFDFIDSPEISGDGNGFDDDPTDPGDNAFGPGQHSFHGTHVTGVFGASTNNGIGVAGVLWEGGVVPVRALGMNQQGADFDILNGLFWAVGETEFDGASIPPNNNPAKVVNLSLGGPVTEQPTQDIWIETIRLVTIQEVERYNEPIIVVAAGNEAQDANNVSPANIPGVITVGATRVDGDLAFYSNFGDIVDVVAPGGEMRDNIDLNGDSAPDGIFSLFDNSFGFEQGTSFAAPHVTGIVGLMLAVDPTLNQVGAEQILRQTADAAGVCQLGCGTGHVNALEALVEVGGIIQDRPQLAVDASRLIYQPGDNQLAVRVHNIGSANLEWQVSVNARQELWSIQPSAGSTPPGEQSTVNVTLDRQGNGSASAALLFEGLNEAAGQEVLVELFFNDLAAPPDVQLATAEVTAFVLDEGQNLTPVASVITSRAENFQWRIEGLDPGLYRVFAVGDDNNDGLYDSQSESFGGWPVASEPETIVVDDNVIVQGVSFGLERGFAVGGGVVGDACINDLDCGFAGDAECITDFQGGYCSRLCDDGFCGAGSSCEILDCDGVACNVCLSRCIDDTQCRAGYVCDAFQTCTPDGF